MSSVGGADTRRAMTAAALAALCAFCACGGEESASTTTRTPFASALAAVGGGGAYGSLGVGWADPQLAKERGVAPAQIADALAPNADTVIDEAGRLRQRFGIDPLAAERLISVGGSYAFGLRLDGVNGRELARRLVSDGATARRRGSLELIKAADWGVMPEALLEVGVHGLGAFDAIGRRRTVLAFSDRARASLLGRGDRLLDEPIYRAAAECLGDVAAARIVPDQHLIGADQGVAQIAVGVDREREVLCTIGGTDERAADIASAFEQLLQPDIRDPVTREPLGRRIATVEVSQNAHDGVPFVRAEMTPEPGGEPGYVFETIATGSLISLINGQAKSSLP